MVVQVGDIVRVEVALGTLVHDLVHLVAVGKVKKKEERERERTGSLQSGACFSRGLTGRLGWKKVTLQWCSIAVLVLLLDMPVVICVLVFVVNLKREAEKARGAH